MFSIVVYVKPRTTGTIFYTHRHQFNLLLWHFDDILSLEYSFDKGKSAKLARYYTRKCSIRRNQWNFIAVAVDRQEYKPTLFINGARQRVINPTPKWWRIKAYFVTYVGGPYWNMRGEMSSLLIYPYILNEIQIKNMYTEGRLIRSIIL
jgi:signal recognition particle subunit SEC65